MRGHERIGAASELLQVAPSVVGRLLIAIEDSGIAGIRLEGISPSYKHLVDVRQAIPVTVLAPTRSELRRHHVRQEPDLGHRYGALALVHHRSEEHTSELQ